MNKLLKIAEDKVKAADQNQTDAVKQLEAAQALIWNELGDKADYDRSITYAEKAVKIIEAPAIRPGLFDCLDDMEAEEDHQAVHQDPEDGEWHGLTHDVTILTLHVAGSGSNGDGLR